MMNIDIERLIDAVAACNEAYNEYCKSAKNLYREPIETIEERSARIEKFTCRRSDPLYSPHWGKH